MNLVLFHSLSTSCYNENYCLILVCAELDPSATKAFNLKGTGMSLVPSRIFYIVKVVKKASTQRTVTSLMCRGLTLLSDR